MSQKRLPPSRYYVKPMPDATGQAKTRRCLRCREEFQSEWAGERICGRCKNGFAWRMGLAGPVSTGRSVHPSGQGAEG